MRRNVNIERLLEMIAPIKKKYAEEAIKKAVEIFGQYAFDEEMRRSAIMHFLQTDLEIALEIAIEISRRDCGKNGKEKET